MLARIGHLVYLDAARLDNGQSMSDLMDEEAKAMLMEVVETYGDGWLMPGNPAVDPRLTPHPLVTGIHSRFNCRAIQRSIPRTYIFCTVKPSDNIVTEITRRSAARQTQGWRYHEIDTGHDPELVIRAVVEILLGLG
ncbi:MAG: hypothetical protein R3A10_22925 [Caldilineaceae bacterium]